ncbi:signal peptidase I [Dendrosporobacter sp. 1207_IL3150]|uniref:signal peptidase I n=1 Tax=Dendrosporobacter sp. 1207_IL3150 TaxID=3084054 RepID=UPI002FDA1B56
MKLLDEIYDWAISLTTAFSLALIINIFVFQPTQVVGNSMQPTLQDSNYIIISKLTHTFKTEPNYGDIVIIDSRVNRDRTWKDDLAGPVSTYLNALGVTKSPGHEVWVKRVIGKPGDILEFKNNKVYRNSIPLDEPYIKEVMTYASNAKIVVPTDHVFVLGDNRNNSSDSRFIGPVKMDHILGTMVLKI